MKSNKRLVVDRLQNVLKGQAMYIKDNDRLSLQDKKEQLDVVFKMAEYLNEYSQELQELEDTEIDLTQ